MSYLSDLTGASGPNTVQSGVSPQLTMSVNKQYSQARNNRLNAPKKAEDLGNIDAAQQKHGLAQSLAGIRSGASSRGLLYSGLRQGAEAGATSNALNSMAANQAGYNRQAEDEAFGQEQQSLQNLEGLRQQEVANSQFQYDQALSNYQAQQEAGSGLFGLMGTIGGAIKGAKK